MLKDVGREKLQIEGSVAECTAKTIYTMRNRSSCIDRQTSYWWFSTSEHNIRSEKYVVGARADKTLLAIAYYAVLNHCSEICTNTILTMNINQLLDVETCISSRIWYSSSYLHKDTSFSWQYIW